MGGGGRPGGSRGRPDCRRRRPRPCERPVRQSTRTSATPAHRRPRAVAHRTTELCPPRVQLASHRHHAAVTSRRSDRLRQAVVSDAADASSARRGRRKPRACRRVAASPLSPAPPAAPPGSTMRRAARAAAERCPSGSAASAQPTWLLRRRPVRRRAQPARGRRGLDRACAWAGPRALPDAGQGRLHDEPGHAGTAGAHGQPGAAAQPAAAPRRADASHRQPETLKASGVTDPSGCRRSNITTRSRAAAATAAGAHREMANACARSMSTRPSSPAAAAATACRRRAPRATCWSSSAATRSRWR